MNSHGVSMTELMAQVRRAELGERTTVGPKVRMKEDQKGQDLTDPRATSDDPELLKGIKKKTDPKKDKGDGQIIIQPNMEATKEEKGAGEDGTKGLVDKYKSMTPGQVAEKASDAIAAAIDDQSHSKDNEKKSKDADTKTRKAVMKDRDSKGAVSKAHNKEQRLSQHRDMRSMTRKEYVKKYAHDADAGSDYDKIKEDSGVEQSRQLKDKETEMMVKHKKTGVKVIDKKDFEMHRAAGYFAVESQEEVEFKEEANMEDSLTEQEIASFEELYEDAVDKRAEDIVKGMKKKQDYFDKKYGDRADNVMYATANKLAREEVEVECLQALDQLDEGTEQHRDITEVIPALNEWLGAAAQGAMRAAPFIAKGAKKGWSWLKNKFKGKKQTGANSPTAGKPLAGKEPTLGKPGTAKPNTAGAPKKPDPIKVDPKDAPKPVSGAKPPKSGGGKKTPPAAGNKTGGKKKGKFIRNTVAATAAAAGINALLPDGEKKPDADASATPKGADGTKADGTKKNNSVKAPPVKKDAKAKDTSSFGSAFKAARKKHGGAGGQFTWNGKKYQTNVKGEKYAKNPTPVGGDKPGTAYKPRKTDMSVFNLKTSPITKKDDKPKQTSVDYYDLRPDGSDPGKIDRPVDKPRKPRDGGAPAKPMDKPRDGGNPGGHYGPAKSKKSASPKSKRPDMMNASYDPELTTAEQVASYISNQVQTDESMSIHVKAHPNGKHYIVQKVGSQMKKHGGIKVGEKLNDTEIDDAGEVGINVKHESTQSRYADFISNQNLAMSPSNKRNVAEVKDEDDDGWYAHREIHGDKGVSKDDWKKGIRMNMKGQRVQTKENDEREALIKAVKNSPKQQALAKKQQLDPVGKDDDGSKVEVGKKRDIDNDGDVDKSDSYLANRRKTVAAVVKHMTGK